jgi:hypothetical protein
MLKRVDVHYLCIKDFHLPIKSTEAEVAAFHAKCKEFGVAGYGVGPIYMSRPEESYGGVRVRQTPWRARDRRRPVQAGR